MFQYPPQRRSPFQTFEFWFLTILLLGGFGAWYTGYLHFGKPQASDPIEVAEAEEVPAPPIVSDELTKLPVDEIRLLPEDSEPAPLQSESSGIALMAPAQIEESSAAPIPPQAEPTQTAALPEQPETTHSDLQATERQNPFAFANTSTALETDDSAAESKLPENKNPFQLASSTTATTKLTPNTTQTFGTKIDFTQIDQLIHDGDDVSAHRLLSTLYWKQPENRDELMDRINTLARRIYFQPQPHYMDAREVRFGERLEMIAKEFQVPWQYLGKLNRVDPQKIQAGQKLKVIRGPFSAIVDLSEYQVTVHAHGYYVTRFPCGIGQDGSTPRGTFKVTDKVENPTYFGPDGVIDADDPSNPLGERWLAISDSTGRVQGYGLHGTIDPTSIGKSESRGCIRLHDADIENLYDLLVVGSEVIIRE